MIEILDSTGQPIAKAANPMQLAKKGQKIMMDLVRIQHGIYRRELDHWKTARLERGNTEAPYTHLLQDLYKDVMLDTHLTSAVEKRVLKVTNKNFVIVDEKGVADYERSKMLETKWFHKVVKYVMESIPYEYSLMLFPESMDGTIPEVICVPRDHVNPDRRLVVKQVYDNQGLLFDKFPLNLKFAKLHDGYGLLEKAAPMTILKRHSWASWDEFEQIFGLPIRIAKLGTISDQVKGEVAEWLKTMGTAAYGVFPSFADIEIKESQHKDAFQVFMRKIESVDSQLSILVNGQTMTTSDGSSRSQAEVHERTEEEIEEDDIKNILTWLNDELVPLLRGRGYDIPENMRIGIERITKPEEKIKIDAQLMQNGYRMTKDYIEKTYGVELEETPTPPEPGKDPKKKKDQ
ncbi:MAG: DUF935 family protein [Bacteroidota bacterium]